MIEKLQQFEARYEELEKLLQQPDVAKNNQLYSQYLKEHGSLNGMVSLYRRYKKVQEDLGGARDLMEKEDDKEMQEMAREEIQSLEKRGQELLDEILGSLASDEDPNKDVIVEIRAGTGGEEACLFTRDLFQLYTKLAERKRWKVEVMDSDLTDLGGFKEVIFAVRGKNAYGTMKYEGGGHRVQRVPVTEGSGRVHTSACTVAVLPEAEEIEIEINPKDLKIDTLRASGPGGQNVNKTSSAVRITHLPSGIVVQCQDTPEQHKNKSKAMRVLRSRLLQKQKTEQHEERNEMRRNQQGTGERSDKVRTYNYPQNRITDHRVKLSLYNLDSVMQSGELDELTEGLRKDERARLLENMEGLGK